MDLQTLQSKARAVRRDIITMTSKAGAGHPGGSLSCTDALVALYFEIMNVDPKNDKDPNRDRFVLSKGHAAPALYGTLCERGYFGPEEFDPKSAPASMHPPDPLDRASPLPPVWRLAPSIPATRAMFIP